MAQAQRKTTLSSAVKGDPILFIETFLVNRDGSPMRLHEKQKELLKGMQGLTVACWGRQTGKSEVMAGYALWLACTHPNYEIYIIAPTVDQSRIIYEIILFQLRNTPLSALVEGKIKEYPFPHTRFINGSSIHGRGANSPQFIRGKRIHRAIVDEGAFIKEKVIPEVIEPMFTVTGQMPDAGITLISTPFGMGDFADYAEIAKSEGFYHHATSMDNPYADQKRLAQVRDRYGEDSLLWQSEYMARFVDGDLAVFPWSSIKWAYEHHPYTDFPTAPLPGHRYVQGVDLANVRDYFVASLLDTTHPTLNPLVRYDRFQKKGYTHYKEIIRSNHRSYNAARTLVDATSLGESVAEDLRDIGAEGYKFSNQSKYEIVQELGRMLSEHRLTIPNDRTIIDELRFFSYEITPSKQLKMEAKRGHDDIVMSLALAAHLACLPSNIGFFAGWSPEPAKSVVQSSSSTAVPDYYDPFKEAFADEI